MLTILQRKIVQVLSERFFAVAFGGEVSQKLSRMMTSYWRSFLTLLFPNVCLGCRDTLADGEELICTVCRYELPRTNSCLTGNPLVTDKFAGKLPIASGHAFLQFRKGGTVQRLLHELKYRDQQAVGVFLGRQFGLELKQAGLSVDLLLPVPLHESRLRQRGYNQCDSIAEGIADVLNVPWSSEVLRKEMATASQTRKTRIERFQNVEHAFAVTQPDRIRNRSIALIDDVVTTGSTLEACGQALLEAGCRELHIWAIASAM